MVAFLILVTRSDPPRKLYREVNLDSSVQARAVMRDSSVALQDIRILDETPSKVA